MLDLDAVPDEDARRARAADRQLSEQPNRRARGARVLRARGRFCEQHDLLLVSDLAYSELTYDGTPAPSALQVDGALDVTIEFHSFSKTFSMAGLRIGFAVGNADAIEALAAYRTNTGYGTPTAVQHAAAFALDHRLELVPPKVAAYRARRDSMVAAFAAAGWTIPVPSASMYLWLQVPEGVDDWVWVQTLIDEDGVVVTPGVAFGDGGRGFFRISLVRDVETLTNAAKLIAARRARMTT